MNTKLKKVFLFLSMISLAVILTVIPSFYQMNRSNLGLWTSYMDKDKQLIETDFYKSNRFEFRVLRPLSYKLGETVRNVDNSIDEYIRENTRTEWVHYTDENGIEQGKDEKKVPTKEEAKNAIEREINRAKEALETEYSGIEFMVINTKDNTYYTNTKYTNIQEYKKNINGYVDVELTNISQDKSYIKKCSNGKTVTNKRDAEYRVLDAIDVDDVKIYISFPKVINSSNLIGRAYSSYDTITMIGKIFVGIGLLNLLIFIIAIIGYKKSNGKLLDKDSKIVNILNKIPFEIWFMPIILGVIGSVTFGLYNYSYEYYYYIENLFSKIIAIGGFFLLLMILYAFMKVLASYDNKIDILKNTITYKVYNFVSKNIKATLSASKKMTLIRNILMVGIACLILSVFMNFMFLGFVPLAIFLWYIIRKLTYLSDIMEGTKKIKEGELDYKIDIKGNDNFTALAENINNIGEGLEKSIDTQLRSERMKSELITNVSHDLKTPLTSIINYVELIKKEENIEPEYIKDYVNVLDSKSKRLKVLIEDLFEASKASSGNIELQMEKIDIKQLLRQAIGEMDEKLSESNLNIKLNVPEESTYIRADGRRLYRVLENLLSNISKYSLENTRVYIDLAKVDGKIMLTMKNISSYELNFDPVEIMERFKRADESRNTEGSGLGLSIARDLINLQGGKFNIDIDGDLFKSVMEFNEVK